MCHKIDTHATNAQGWIRNQDIDTFIVIKAYKLKIKGYDDMMGHWSHLTSTYETF